MPWVISEIFPVSTMEHVVPGQTWTVYPPALGLRMSYDISVYIRLEDSANLQYRYSSILRENTGVPYSNELSGRSHLYPSYEVYPVSLVWRDL